MPVCIEDNTQTQRLLNPSPLDGNSAMEYQGWGDRCLHIGLINNMPDGALEATERQFLTLLDAAATEGMLVRVSFYALPNVPRNDWGRYRVKHFYSGVESLYKSRLDGLIVTGREPRTSNLKDEPYWQ